MCRCLYCYRPLKQGEKDFHPNCARKFFGTEKVPVLDYTCKDLDQLALQIIKDRTSLTGVQPKLSLHLNEHEGSQRLTIVGLWGDFICKPQTMQFKSMPETEDLTMHLAEVAKIDVVPHTLMRMADGTLCYLLSDTKGRQKCQRGKDGDGRYVPAYRAADRVQIQKQL